jgi:hypothetical protein
MERTDSTWKKGLADQSAVLEILLDSLLLLFR